MTAVRGEKTADILNAMLTVSDDTVKYKGEDLLRAGNTDPGRSATRQIGS